MLCASCLACLEGRAELYISPTDATNRAHEIKRGRPPDAEWVDFDHHKSLADFWTAVCSWCSICSTTARKILSLYPGLEPGDLTSQATPAQADARKGAPRRDVLSWCRLRRKGQGLTSDCPSVQFHFSEMIAVYYPNGYDLAASEPWSLFPTSSIVDDDAAQVQL
jgi:hypothetical protein